MSQSKTEQPTPRRLKKARASGEVAKSAELGSAAVLLAAAGMLTLASHSLHGTFASLFAISSDMESASQPVAALRAGAWLGVKMMAPLLLVCGLAAGVAMFAQVGPVFGFPRVAPQFERVNPARGLRQLFSRDRWAELLKTFVKLALVGVVLVVTVSDVLRGVLSLSLQQADTALVSTGQIVVTLLWRVGLVLLALGAVDAMYQRWRFLEDRKMTKEEVKRERRETEGDPHAKLRRAQMHRKIADHAISEDVRRCALLVVNGDTSAVALRYDDEVEAAVPTIVAKGTDRVARQMIEFALQADISVSTDSALATALFDVEAGASIPADLYEATARALHAVGGEDEGIEHPLR